MNCYKCKNKMRKQVSSYIKCYNDKIAVIENTPKFICSNCYEEFYKEEVIRNIDEIASILEEMPIKLLMVDYKRIKKYFFR